MAAMNPNKDINQAATNPPVDPHPQPQLTGPQVASYQQQQQYAAYLQHQRYIAMQQQQYIAQQRYVAQYIAQQKQYQQQQYNQYYQQIYQQYGYPAMVQAMKQNNHAHNPS